MSEVKIHPGTDYQLVREIYAAAAATAIGAPTPGASGVAFRPGGINFDSMVEKSVRAASALAACEEKRKSGDVDSYMKSMNPE